MKKIISVLFLTAIFFFTKAGIAVAQTDSTAAKPYDIVYKNNEKTLRGLLKRSDIENDTTFAWFKHNYSLGKPDASAVAAFKNHANDFQMIVFGGTWCEDTQNLLPQFFHLTDEAGYADSNITLIGVDRSKKTLDNLNAAFHITNVPTFIVMKDGKEVGRVIEYGKSGNMVKELGEIVAGL